MIYRRISGLHPEMERMPHAIIENYRTIDNFFLVEAYRTWIYRNYDDNRQTIQI